MPPQILRASGHAVASRARRARQERAERLAHPLLSAPCMKHEDPIVVALAFDAEARDVLLGAAELARRMSRPLLVVHAIGRPLPGEPASRAERQIARAHEDIEGL